RRALELQLPGSALHLGRELLHDAVGVTVEEVDELLDELVVAGLVDLSDAGPRALLDVEQQAGPAEPLVGPELARRARTDREGPQQQVEGVPDGIRVA